MRQFRFDPKEFPFPLAEVANDYLNHLIDRGLTFNTVLNNFNSLKSFLHWCEGETNHDK